MVGTGPLIGDGETHTLASTLHIIDTVFTIDRIMCIATFMVLITVIIFIASETVLQITVHAILQAEVRVDILEIVRENQPQQDRTQATDQVFLVRIIDLV